MTHKLGVSGSTIMSDPEKLNDLFGYQLSHVEIGEFPNEASFQKFLKLAEQNQVTFGIHSPLIRGNSKYDLIEKVSVPTELARDNFEKEVSAMKEAGAAYVLVHFPYFRGERRENPSEMIEEGLSLLSSWQLKYGIPIVCEPKLGVDQSSLGIEYLHEFSENLWKSYGLSICIDIGDYRMAAGDQWKKYLKPLLPFVKVVHLHNVAYLEEEYLWIPVHPELESSSHHYAMQPMIEYLASGREKFFVFEHTPHSRPSRQMVAEGIQWVHNLIE
ncbi:TIM barrel protein [Halobacillus rhizosphaerae]|uniref:TIM barrel protein n=1 Tax=Halobacillus rhizosphaerae TaxID=3064889 RepID=UPI00398A7260